MCNSTLYTFHKMWLCILKYWKQFVMKNIWLVKVFGSFPYHRDVFISNKLELISNNLEFHRC